MWSLLTWLVHELDEAETPAGQTERPAHIKLWWSAGFQSQKLRLINLFHLITCESTFYGDFKVFTVRQLNMFHVVHLITKI